MKGVVLVTLLVAFAIAEPPVENRYLPPQEGGAGYRTTNQDRFSPPSQNYGAPQRQTDAVLRPRPSSNYGAPARSTARRPSAQYGPPQNGAPRQGPPSAEYGPPQNGAPRQGPPSAEYGAPQGSQQLNGPSFGSPSQQYGPPSQQYGAPPSFGGLRQSGGSVYGAPGARLRNGAGGDEEGNEEPANYSFDYMVKDDQSGNDFGHRESRMGDRAEGLYYVLLPDGRKQTVEYEADEAGYRPKISYEDTGAGRGGGYNSNSQDGYQDGYQNGGGGYQK